MQVQTLTQSEWEAETGWGARLEGDNKHPVQWITGSRKHQPEGWPALSAWDHAVPVQHRETGERAYLLMPYGLSEAAAEQLGEWCDGRGLTFDVDQRGGWWRPGTCAVLVRAESANII